MVQVTNVETSSDLRLEPLSRDAIGLQIRLQWSRNGHAPVGLLICLKERHEQPRQRRAAAVENVRELVFSRLRFETEVHPPRLEILAIRTARDFEITSLPRRPDLEVI